MKLLRYRVTIDKINARYRATMSDILSNKIAASVIVNAILFDTKVVQLVVRSTGNCLEQKWELMSVFDKDELDSKKKIFFSKGFFANVSN